MNFKDFIIQVLTRDYLPIDVLFSLAGQYYYKNRNEVIGKSGDFITAPESSQMFCHAIGVWLYNAINKRNSKKIALVELGPGYGTLTNDVIQFLRQDKTCINKIQNVFLMEASSSLLEKQKMLLQKYAEIQFNWISNFEDLYNLNDEYSLVFIANEFFDAMPVKQFIKIGNAFHEVFVGENLKLFHSENTIKTHQMEKIMQYSNCRVEDFAEGDLYELSTVSLSNLDHISILLKKYSGSCLIIDYGYKQTKKQNTIQAIAEHQILDNFLMNIGEADISAHVDFGSMINLINTNHKELEFHYENQHDFLERHHIKEIMETTIKHIKDPLEMHTIISEFNKISVSMGDFKVLEIHSK